MPVKVLDVEQSLLLLELEPPFDKRAVQLARRRMAKRWHPDIAPPGRQHEHERHLKAINEAADQLERLAEDSRGGSVSRNAVRASAAAARRRARRRAGAPTRPSSAPAPLPPTPSATTRSAPAFPTTRSCTATRAASPTRSGASAASPASTSRATSDEVPAVGAREVPGRHSNGARGLAAVRRLLHARRRAPSACSAS